MTTQQQIFAEVKNTFKAYDSESLLDEISMERWMKSELKRFGNNIMVYTDDVVHVRNGKGKLPDDFWKLKAAVKYSPSHYECDEKDKEFIKKTAFWINTTDKTQTFVDGNLVTTTVKNTVKEDYYINDIRVTLHYSNPQILKLTKGFNRKAVETDCANLPHKLTEKRYNEINILGDYIQCDFREGYIYVIYKALPMDENGEMYVPTTQHDRLKEYIIAYLEYRVARDIWLNNDDPNITNKIQYLDQKQQELFSLAMTETKMETLTKDTFQELKKRNRYKYTAVSNMFPR
jgi:hypothetical protein